MAIVYPTMDAVVRWSGGAQKVAPDQPWDDRAQLVQERPELFGPKPGRVYGVPPGEDIEQATRAPGEKRATKRKSGDSNGAG